MKKLLVLLLIVGVVSIGFAGDRAAEKKHPIDLRVDKLLEANDSTAGQIQAFTKGCELWDQELKRVYKQLLAALETDKTSKSALTASQIDWMKFRGSELKFLSSMYSKKEGTMYRPMYVHDLMHILRYRTIELNNRLLTVQE